MMCLPIQIYEGDKLRFLQTGKCSSISLKLTQCQRAETRPEFQFGIDTIRRGQDPSWHYLTQYKNNKDLKYSKLFRIQLYFKAYLYVRFMAENRHPLFVF